MTDDTIYEGSHIKEKRAAEIASLQANTSIDITTMDDFENNEGVVMNVTYKYSDIDTHIKRFYTGTKVKLSESQGPLSAIHMALMFMVADASDISTVSNVEIEEVFVFNEGMGHKHLDSDSINVIRSITHDADIVMCEGKELYDNRGYPDSVAWDLTRYKPDDLISLSDELIE